MGTTRLTIAIPTYNRSAWARKLVVECLRQIDEDKLNGYVDVVVLDNASPDNTFSTLVRVLDTRIDDSLKLFKSQTNTGVANFHNVVAMATGEYVWLMGDDDCPVPGAIKCMLDEVIKGAGVYILSAIDTDLKDNEVRRVSWLRDWTTRVYELWHPEGAQRCFTNIQTLGGMGGLLSVVCARREDLLWGFKRNQGWADKNPFPHVAALLKAAICRACDVVYVKDPMVKYRVGNDKNTPQAHWRRMMMDFQGWAEISSQLFHGDPVTQDAFNAICRRHHGVRTLPTLKAFSDNEQPWSKARAALVGIGYSSDCLELLDFIDVKVRKDPGVMMPPSPGGRKDFQTGLR